MKTPVQLAATNTGQKIAEGTDGAYVVRRGVLQIKSANWAGNSIVLKQIAAGAAATGQFAVPGDLKNVPYTDRTTGGLVAGGTAIAADSLIEVDMNGVDLYAVPTIGGVAVVVAVVEMAG